MFNQKNIRLTRNAIDKYSELGVSIAGWSVPEPVQRGLGDRISDAVKRFSEGRAVKPAFAHEPKIYIQKAGEAPLSAAEIADLKKTAGVLEAQYIKLIEGDRINFLLKPLKAISAPVFAVEYEQRISSHADVINDPNASLEQLLGAAEGIVNISNSGDIDIADPRIVEAMRNTARVSADDGASKNGDMAGLKKYAAQIGRNIESILGKGDWEKASKDNGFRQMSGLAQFAGMAIKYAELYAEGVAQFCDTPGLMKRVAKFRKGFKAESRPEDYVKAVEALKAKAGKAYSEENLKESARQFAAETVARCRQKYRALTRQNIERARVVNDYVAGNPLNVKDINFGYVLMALKRGELAQKLSLYDEMSRAGIKPGTEMANDYMDLREELNDYLDRACPQIEVNKPDINTRMGVGFMAMMLRSAQLPLDQRKKVYDAITRDPNSGEYRQFSSTMRRKIEEMGGMDAMTPEKIEELQIGVLGKLVGMSFERNMIGGFIKGPQKVVAERYPYACLCHVDPDSNRFDPAYILGIPEGRDILDATRGKLIDDREKADNEPFWKRYSPASEPEAIPKIPRQLVSHGYNGMMTNRKCHRIQAGNAQRRAYVASKRR